MTDLHQQLLAHVPVEAQRAIVRAFKMAYSMSEEICNREFDERQRVQSWGYVRWLKIDSELLKVGERFGRVEHFPCNTENTHIGHTELHFGPFILTATRIQDRGRVPSHAAWRERLATLNETSLFECMRGIEPTNSGQIWAPLLHVPNVHDRTLKGLYVGFLTSENRYACEHFDLLAHVDQMKEPSRVEMKPSRPLIKLKDGTA